MNLKQIRDGVLDIIGNDTSISTSGFNKMINAGKHLVETKILDENKNFFPDNESIAVTAGDVSITPTKTWSSVKLIQIDFTDTDESYQNLIKSDLTTVLGANPTDTRSFLLYCIWGNAINIPNFNKAATIRIYGYVVPDDLTDDEDAPEFSVLLHYLLVTYTVACALEASSSSEDFISAKRKRDEFWNDLDEILPTVMSKDATNVRNLT